MLCARATAACTAAAAGGGSSKAEGGGAAGPPAKSVRPASQGQESLEIRELRTLGFSGPRGQDGSRAPPAFFEVQIRVRRWTVQVATETVRRAGPARLGEERARDLERLSHLLPPSTVQLQESPLCPHCVPPTVLEAAGSAKNTRFTFTYPAGWLAL